jgi:hypothetical protein
MHTWLEKWNICSNTKKMSKYTSVETREMSMHVKGRGWGQKNQLGQWSSICGLGVTGGPWDPCKGIFVKSKLFPNCVKSLFAFLAHSLSWVYSESLQRQYDVLHSKGSNIKADTRSQLSAIKPYIKELYKSGEQC